jgi:hypothetical protein
VKRTKFKKKRISVGSAKAKGRELQKWVCQKISDLTSFPWGKDQPIESRPMGQSGVDVRLEKSVLKLFPFSVESKRWENWSVPSWIEQARKNQLSNTDWLVIMRKSHKPPVIVMDGEAFFRLLEKVKKPCGDSS